MYMVSSESQLTFLYFAWARSKVKVCYYFHILWRRAVLAQLPDNTAHSGKYIACLGKYSTLNWQKLVSVAIWPILL